MNGRLALDAVAAELSDVILLDLMMPEIDGFELVVALQATAARREAAQQWRANSFSKFAFHLAELVACDCAVRHEGEAAKQSFGV